MFKLFKKKELVDLENITDEMLEKWEEQRRGFIKNIVPLKREEA